MLLKKLTLLIKIEIEFTCYVVFDLIWYENSLKPIELLFEILNLLFQIYLLFIKLKINKCQLNYVFKIFIL